MHIHNIGRDTGIDIVIGIDLYLYQNFTYTYAHTRICIQLQIKIQIHTRIPDWGLFFGAFCLACWAVPRLHERCEGQTPASVPGPRFHIWGCQVAPV